MIFENRYLSESPCESLRRDPVARPMLSKKRLSANPSADMKRCFHCRRRRALETPQESPRKIALAPALHLPFSTFLQSSWLKRD